MRDHWMRERDGSAERQARPTLWRYTINMWTKLPSTARVASAHAMCTEVLKGPTQLVRDEEEVTDRNVWMACAASGLSCEVDTTSE